MQKHVKIILFDDKIDYSYLIVVTTSSNKLPIKIKTGVKQKWSMRREMRTPRYMKSWDEISVMKG